MLIFNDEDAARLARVLFEEMERLDPQDDRSWSELSPRQRDFYALCVRKLLDALPAMNSRDSDRHVVCG